MKQIWFLGTMGAVSSALFCIYCLSLRDADADTLDAALLQTPVAATIHQELAAHAADKPPMPLAKRQDLFAERFTERFRQHEPKMAVRARFEVVNHVRNRIKLMCPARLEPWNMDRVALSVWRESKVCLGENYDVDLYATFIGSAPRKIGELRSKSNANAVADIHYTPMLSPIENARNPGLPTPGKHPANAHGLLRPFAPATLPVVALHP